MSAAVALRWLDPADAVLGQRRFRMTLTMRIERWEVRRDGPLTEAALQQKIEGLGYEVTTRLLPAGAAAATRNDVRDRIVAVARGVVKVTIDGESAILGAGDLAHIPPAALQRVEVIGSAAALCFEAVAPLEAA
jgi:mannose-6-phosphate isomerase-like protein (cupin superfamily)